MYKIHKAQFMLCAAWKSQWPENDLPEICLAGRSNVGKSSFITVSYTHLVRSVNPGHIIRGGDITPYDRILSIRFGVKACELIDEGQFGNVVTLHGETMDYTSLEEVIGDAKFGKQKRVDPNGELIRAAKAIGVCFGDE